MGKGFFFVLILAKIKKVTKWKSVILAAILKWFLLVNHWLKCINQNIQCSISKKILMVKYFQKGGGRVWPLCTNVSEKNLNLMHLCYVICKIDMLSFIYAVPNFCFFFQSYLSGLFSMKIPVGKYISEGRRGEGKGEGRGGGLLSPKSYVDMPAGPQKSDYLYTNFLPNFPPISKTIFNRKAPNLTKFWCFLQ